MQSAPPPVVLVNSCPAWLERPPASPLPGQDLIIREEGQPDRRADEVISFINRQDDSMDKANCKVQDIPAN